jgi:hypothetical protein
MALDPCTSEAAGSSPMVSSSPKAAHPTNTVLMKRQKIRSHPGKEVFVWLSAQGIP